MRGKGQARAQAMSKADCPELVTRRVLLSHEFFTVYADQLRWPDGTLHSWVYRHAPFVVVSIAALDSAGNLVLVRQYRPPLGEYTLEFPGGLVEPGENLLEGGLRELAEETGYLGEAAEAALIAERVPQASATSDMLMNLLFVPKARRAGKPQNPAPQEKTRVCLVPWDKLRRHPVAVLSPLGRFPLHVLAWIAVLREHLGQ